MFGLGAQVQYHTLPEHAQDALVSRAADLVDQPWDDVTIRPPGIDPRYRETVFGAGRGILGIFVDDNAETITIFDILWSG